MTIITELTQNSAPPKNRRYDITCELRPGFLLRVEPTGSMSYKYRRRERNAMKVTTLAKVYGEAAAVFDISAYKSANACAISHHEAIQS
jgi:hypothetical protein